MPVEVKVTLKNPHGFCNVFNLDDGESATVYSKNPNGITESVFSVLGKRAGGDILSTNNYIHLPCFQRGSDKLLQVATIELTDKVVEVRVV